MKKIYFLSVFIALVGVNLKASFEVIQGGNMEDSTKWTVTQIDTIAGQEATVTFNDTTAIPSAGSGGAMHVTATNALPSTGNNVMIWQKVALKAGHRYVVDAAFKDLGNLPIQAFWCQWFVEKKTPVIAEDPYPEASARAQINTWNSCLADYAGIDITLQTWECENGAQSDTVVVSQDTIYTYGVKMGVYNAAVVSYDIVIDNMSLLDIDTLNENAISTINAVSVNVFPNPATDVIYIENASQFTQASILNVLGQEVMYVTKLNNSIDVAGLRSGMYFIKLTDKYNNIAVSKFQKQ